jgi:ABC-type oligopeptide transport system ATPase subunit
VTQRTLKMLLYAATVALINQIPKKKQKQRRNQGNEERKRKKKKEIRSFSYRKMSRNMHVKCQRKERMIEVKVETLPKQT